MTIVSMVVHGWPGPPWEAERLEAYVEAILPWDAEHTSRALASARNQLKYRPSIAELREFMQLERRQAEARAQEEAWRNQPAEAVAPLPVPEYVSVWWWMLSQGDRRRMPQWPDHDEQTMTMPEYEAVRDAWVAAGSPPVTAVAQIMPAGTDAIV